MLEFFVKYLHLICFAIMGAVLFTELILVSNKMKSSSIHKISILDAIYGLSALVIFILGLVLWFYIGKPSSFYTVNIFFKIKIILFIFLGILSIYPTIFFIKNRKFKDDIIVVPNSIKIIIIIEIFIFLLIPFFAILMANGYGL